MDKGISDVAAAVNECFQSASNGKTLIAAALTGKGQASTVSDTYAQMAAKIGNLMAVPTATKNITANGNNIDVTNFAKVNVNVDVKTNVALGNRLAMGNHQVTISNATIGNLYLISTTYGLNVSGAILLSGAIQALVQGSTGFNVAIVLANSSVITATTDSNDSKISICSIYRT